MIITQTPLRVSLSGGGTDLKCYYSRRGGEVVTAAIDKYVYVVLKKRFDDRIKLNHSETEMVTCPEDIRHDLVREAMKVCGVERGVEISTLSDVPAGGAGLGSSSSVTVGLLCALHQYQLRPTPPEALAEEAVHIEVGILGKPIGKQDQYAAACGGLCHILFNKDNTVSVERLLISTEARYRLESHLMLLYTGIERDANVILDDLRNNISARERVLDGIRDLVPRMRSAVSVGDMEEVGHILDENWQLKKVYAAKATTGALDSIYQRAIDAGAYGGKISGAGGGGFFLLCCPPHRQESVRQTLGFPKNIPFRLAPDGSKVLLNIRRE